MADLFGATEAKATTAPPPTKAKPKKKAAAKAVAKPTKKAEPKKATGTAVAVHKPKPPRAAKGPTNAMQMLSFIGNAATNPNVDPAKMRELLAIRKELKDEEAAEAFEAALVQVQKKLAVVKITKRGNIEIYAKTDPEHRNPPIQKTPFARYEDLSAIIKPILIPHDFTLRHKNGISAAGRVTVTTVLAHVRGHKEESFFEGEADASGSKNNVQGRGSTISYGKRYNTVSLLDLVAEGQDDDGALGAGETIEPEQLTELLDKCAKHGVDQAKFKTFLKVPTLAGLPASRFKFAMDEIDRIKPLAQGGR